MFRGAGNVYARFTDIFDPPEEEPTAVFSSDGKIEFVKTDEDASPKPSLPGRIPPQKKPPVRMSKKAAAFLFLCAIVFGLIIFTFTNFIILMQNRTKISSNYMTIKELPDQLRLKPEELNASVQNALAIWSDNVTSRLREELRIRPEQIDDAVQQALTKWSDDNIPRLKDELRIKPEDVDAKVESAMTKWSSDILPRLKDELRIKPEELDSRIQSILTNWTSSNIPRIKDELRVKQTELNDRVRSALSNWSAGVVQRMKEDLKVKPEQISASVQRALDVWSVGVLARLKDELRIKPEVLDSKIQSVFSNMSEQVASRLRAELHMTPELLDGKIEMSLANLSENILNRLKDELEISPSQVEAGIKRVMANMSERALAMLKGVCDITYGDKCYWAVESGAIQFQHAASLCHNHGAEAADITSDEQYQEMLTYLRTKMPPLKTVWLGMTRNITDEKIYMENGEVLNYTLSWYPNYPLRWTAYTHIGLHFEKDVSAIKQGFFNDRAGSLRHGILCEL